MTNVADVTVVIPTRDRWRFLRTTLASVFDQIPSVPRILVVDDGSSDGTRDRLAETAPGNLEVIGHDRSRGVSAARNLGLEHVRSDWVAFLDDDDLWAPHHLSALVAAVDEALRPGSVVAAYGGSVTTDASRVVTKVKRPPPVSSVPATLLVSNAIATPSRVIMRTSTVRDLGGFDESLAVTADWDLYLRLVQVGDLASSTDLTVGYTEHGDNMHLAADLALREFPRLDARYASTAGGAKERAFTDACSNWIATSYRTSGRRFSAARWYLRSFRSQGERRDLGRALGMLLGERVIRASGLQRKENPPAGIAPWLERLARIDELPEDVVPWARAAGAAGRFTH